MATLQPSQDVDVGEARQKLRRSAKGTTCTHCRQLKLKCDAASVYPDPCSRCRRAGHNCTIDPQFRRRGAREYTQSLEKEVQTLRQRQDKSPSSGTSPSDHPTAHSSGSGGNVGGDILEDVRLSPATTVSLIDMYYAHYHPFFPILADRNEFMAEYNANQLLLWTILAIASRGREDMPNVYASLVEPVRRLAGDIYAPQSRSLKTMQALLLLCVWPFPHQQTVNDPSPMYCSLATHIGQQLGLHRPLHRSDFKENAIGPTPSGLMDRKTWYGCFIVNQGMAMRLGTPSVLSPGHAIVSAISNPTSDVPMPLLLGLNIAYASYVWLKALGDDETTSNGQHPSPQHLIPSFEGHLAQIVSRFQDQAWPKFLKVEFDGLKCQLYSFALHRPESAAHEQHEPFLASATNDILQAKALSATIDLAAAAKDDISNLQYWPVIARFKVVFAACFGVFLAAKTSDETMRHALLETCQNNAQLLFSWSAYSRDSFFRLAKHVATAIRRIQSHGPQGFLSAADGSGRPAITSRMGSNVAYELVWNAKHGKTPESEQVPPVYTAGTQQQQTVAHHPAASDTNIGVVQAAQGPQIFGYSLQDIDDTMFWKDWTEADFTDIALDWQSMIDAPGQTWQGI